MRVVGLLTYDERAVRWKQGQHQESWRWSYGMWEAQTDEQRSQGASPQELLCSLRVVFILES